LSHTFEIFWSLWGLTLISNTNVMPCSTGIGEEHFLCFCYWQKSEKRKSTSAEEKNDVDMNFTDEKVEQE
jgi:hypothetical protein